LLEELRVHPKCTAEAQALLVRVLQAIAAVVSITTNFRDWL
jgi:hypothetical protein